MRLPIIAAAACSLALAGCYDSDNDLIGQHAVLVQKADTLIVYRSQVYSAQNIGTANAICVRTLRVGLPEQCASPIEVKLERTFLGNYLVQVHQGQTYKFALWTRSEGINGSLGRACLLWLGDGITGTGTGPDDLFNGDLTYARFAAFRQLKAELSGTASHLDSRDALLKITAAYEGAVVANGYTCFDDRVTISDPKLLVILGDNRHLPDFIPGP